MLCCQLAPNAVQLSALRTLCMEYRKPLTNFVTNERMLKAPASERNKEHILQVLKEHVSAETPGNALEIASGPGTHATLFAQHYKNVTWQPSDIEPQYINSISEYKRHFNLSNMKEPLRIDITTPVGEWKGDFPEKSLEMMVNINMIHISPWDTAQGLFKTAGLLLNSQGHLFLYGPFSVHGVLTPDSNVQFDQQLKWQNEKWGIRDIGDVEREGNKNGLVLKKIHEMPANNKTLVFQKT